MNRTVTKERREATHERRRVGVDVAVFKQGYRTAYKNESVTVYAVDRDEAAQKARNEVGRGDE